MLSMVFSTKLFLISAWMSVLWLLTNKSNCCLRYSIWHSKWEFLCLRFLFSISLVRDFLFYAYNSEVNEFICFIWASMRRGDVWWFGEEVKWHYSLSIIVPIGGRYFWFMLCYDCLFWCEAEPYRWAFFLCLGSLHWWEWIQWWFVCF